MWHAIHYYFLHWTGSDNVSGPEYGFWSGFGSDLTEFVTFTATPVLLYRRHNCHQKRCWRLGKYPYKHFMYCAKHHPEV